MDSVKIIVPGGLHTDIVASGVQRIAGPGELATGKELRIAPGGKSRNIAAMVAALTGPGTVAMIGKTAKDPFGLWRIPVDALNAAGVDTKYVVIEEFKGKFPAVALIAVDEAGDNQIYVLPGINSEFSAADIDAALPLFETAGKNSSLLVLSLELPLMTALRAMEYAEQYGFRIILDPGGVEAGVDYSALLKKKIFLLKPNEHEAELLTGIAVVPS